jgi:ORF6N domain-containing protein
MKNFEHAKEEPRNRKRFPGDFMVHLTAAEWENLKSQIVISSSDWGGRRHAPYAFTEKGVAMLSSVLKSKRAVKVNIEIMTAFVRHRQMLATDVQLARRLDALENKYDAQFKVVFDAIRQLMKPPETRNFDDLNAAERWNVLNVSNGLHISQERAARYGRA